MIRLTTPASTLIVLSVLTGAAFGQTASRSCDQLTKFKLTGTELVIAKAESTPEFCRVDGTIDPRTGVGGKSYGIGFAIALPANWNGGFLFQGGGGLNGNVARPLGSQAAGDTPALARGFAVVTTDSGHKGAVFDGSFMQDQQAALDFAYAAIGRVTQVAKLIVAEYYGQTAKHSYFDGVIAGDPAMRAGYSNLADAWVTVALNQIAPKDDAGKPVAARVFSDSDKKLIVNSVLEQCDAADGLKDGMIFNARACHFAPSRLVCKGAKSEGCLSSAQAEAIERGFAGPKNA